MKIEDFTPGMKVYVKRYDDYATVCEWDEMYKGVYAYGKSVAIKYHKQKYGAGRDSHDWIGPQELEPVTKLHKILA